MGKKKRRLNYGEISDYYENLIRMGKLVAGERMMTEEALCRKHGVARTTIRRAFSLLVKKGLVIKEQGRGTFVASMSDVENRARGHVVIVAYQTLDLDSAVVPVLRADFRFSYGYLEAVAGALQDHARPFRIRYINKDPASLDDLERSIQEAGDLAIITFDIDELQTFHRIMSIGVPVVLVDSLTFDVEVDVIQAANREGMKQAALHLLKTSDGPVAFVGPEHAQWLEGPHRQRFQGFEDAHSEVGRKPDKKHLHFVERANCQGGHEAIREMLKHSSLPAGMVCSDDALALGALDELRVAGINVPKQVGLIGFGDFLALFFTEPSLSTVSVDRKTMGLRAVELLEERLSNPRGHPKYISVPTRLMLRQSTVALPLG